MVKTCAVCRLPLKLYPVSDCNDEIHQKCMIGTDFEESQRIATEFNERIWSHPNMAAALRLVNDAKEQLETGNGWGKLALEQARASLAGAILLIQNLEQL